MKIQELSQSERIILAQELWDSVAADQGAVEVSDEQKKLLDQRLKSFEISPDEGSSWSDVKSRILKS